MSESRSQVKSFDIPKQMVWEAYLRVKANKGAAGVDGVTIEQYEQDLKNNLFKLWNRMSSGSYFPPPVKAVDIPKPGGVRILGVPSWHRWTVLAMLAQAFLAVTTAAKHASPPPTGLIPLTVNEVRRLFTGLLTRPVQTPIHLLQWSRWRRRHQAAARTSHYRRQAENYQ